MVDFFSICSLFFRYFKNKPENVINFVDFFIILPLKNAIKQCIILCESSKVLRYRQSYSIIGILWPRGEV